MIWLSVCSSSLWFCAVSQQAGLHLHHSSQGLKWQESRMNGNGFRCPPSCLPGTFPALFLVPNMEPASSLSRFSLLALFCVILLALFCVILLMPAGVYCCGY